MDEIGIEWNRRENVMSDDVNSDRCRYTSEKVILGYNFKAEKVRRQLIKMKNK